MAAASIVSGNVWGRFHESWHEKFNGYIYKRLLMCVYNTILALHIDTTALSDGTYDLISESDGGDLEAQVNTAVLTEAPDQSSEEPRAEIVSDYREGKPRT